MVNQIFLVGNIGHNATQRQTSTGGVVTEFSIAVNERTKDGTKTEWFNITIWGDGGTKILSYLTKGRLVHVSGRLTVSRYTDKNNQEKMSVGVTVYGNGVTLLPDGKNENQGQQQVASPYPQAAPAPAYQGQQQVASPYPQAAPASAPIQTQPVMRTDIPDPYTFAQPTEQGYNSQAAPAYHADAATYNASEDLPF